MQELDPKILGKIKKCLALSASDNPNEAATAMRQAHALMEKHGVTAEGIIMGDIGEAKIKSRTMARNKPEQWEAYLASTVGKAFGCSMMVGSYVPTATARIKTINDGSFIFVGLKGQAQVAAYTADVLVRRCKAARGAWIKENLGEITALRGGKKRATRLGNEFALGWVHRIAQLVHNFARPPEIERAIEQYIEAHTNIDGELPIRSTRSSDRDAAVASMASMAGMKAAAAEHLHRPVNGAAPQQQLGTSN